MADESTTYTRRKLLAALGGTATVAVAGCANTTDQPTETSSSETTTEAQPTTADAADSVVSVNGEGATSIQLDTLTAQLADYPTNELSDEEISGLKFMREEEKLAHDLYTELHSEFEYRAFENIAASEQTHTDAVALLLEKYDIPDPVTGEPGSFSNPDLQSLYDSLLEIGRQSGEDALKVAAEVEEVDIVDIQERADATDEEAITLVYDNLIRGSRNHIRAFVRVLEREGASYSPQHLSQSEYDEIIASSIERGSGNSRT